MRAPTDCGSSTGLHKIQARQVPGLRKGSGHGLSPLKQEAIRNGCPLAKENPFSPMESHGYINHPSEQVHAQE